MSQRAPADWKSGRRHHVQTGPDVSFAILKQKSRFWSLSHFGMREPLKAQFRIEALNFTNHPNFSNPDSGVTDPDFGPITSTNPGSRAAPSVAVRFDA
jgi:hypothetical protein